MSNILTGFNMQGNDPIDNRIVSPSKFETLEEYLQRVPIQKRYYGLSFYALDENNELRHYTFQTSLIEPTIDDDEEEIERLDKELQEHVNNKEIHKTSEEIRSEIVDADIPDTIARVQWTLDKIEEAVNTVMGDIVDGASDEYNTLKKIQDKIVELRTEMESQLYGDDGGEILKTLEQALKFLNQYKDFIVDIPDNYVNKQDIVDNLNTDDPTKVLSARQGKVLSETLTNYFDSAIASIRAETNRATNAENRIETKLDKEIDRSIKEDQRIDSKLDAEIERSTNEDIRIDTKLDSEINRSTTEDNRLDEKIDAETTRATDAESNLNTKIETETDRAESEESRIETKLDNEIARSTNKDTEHDNRLTALEGDTHEQNTDLGTTNSTFQLKYNTGNKIKHESDAISVRNAADTDYVNFIAKNATFKGDLLVEGQSFVTEAETVEIKDNLLLLNKGEVGAGVTKGIAGLEIDRGTEPNYFIVFDESDNRFKAGVEGDLWNLALRESDDNMLDGYFISWNSKDKILSTTNIVNESTPLLFGRTDYKRYSGDIIYQENVYSSYSFIDETPQGTLYNSAGENNWNINTTKFNFRFWKPILGTTFRRTSDNSEVLYHVDIVNNLTSGGTNKVLSAEQGKLLQNSITSIQGSYLPLSGGTMTGPIAVPYGWDIRTNDGNDILKVLSNKSLEIGHLSGVTKIRSNSNDILHVRNDTSYKIWDASNLPTPASTTDLANYLPLVGGTLTGQLTIKQEVDIKLRLQSTDADNHCIIQAINSQASQLGVFGYAGNKWAIGHGGTYYEIWDKYNLTNPVTYTTDTYNYATLRNKDGQYFTYIKAGTNGLLPHSQVTLANGGAGFLGTSDQGFNAGYINHLYTNKISFGVNGPYIIGGTSATQFLDANGGVQKVAAGGLYVGVSYASDALNLVPTNGIYSRGAIKSYTGFTSDFRISNLTIARTGNDVLHISSFVNDSENRPGIDPISSQVINEGVALTYFWQGDFAFQLVGDIDGTGMAYRRYTPSTGASGTWKFLADTNWVVSKINSSTSNYLPLTGGTLSGNLTINTVGSTTLVINNNDTNVPETFMRVLRKGTASAAIGFRDSLGAYIYNYNSKKYLFIDNDGYARVGTTSGSTRLALITDIPSISGYLPLSGGTMSGNISFNGDTGHIVVGARETSNYVSAVSFNKGSATNSALIGYHSTGGSDSSGALILVPYSTSAYPWAKTVGLYIAKNELLLDGKAIATTDQIPSIPSISISNSGSGNAVTAITASGHTLTVTKGATYLTSSSLSGYATQSWVTSQGYLTSSSLSGYATQTWANGRFLPLSGGKLTGDLSFQETSGIILRPSNDSYISGIFADIQGNECVAVWAKNTVTRLRWHAGIDMSDGTANLMMGITPDFEITKASGTAIGKIAGNEILHSNNYTSYTVTKTGGGASGTWGINVSGNAATATTATKLGSSTVGSSSLPIYLNAGTPTACSTTLGVSITGNAATATNSTQLGGTAASSYVKANDNISRLTNDRNYVRSTSTLKVADIQVLDGGTPGSEAGILYIVLE